MNSKSTWYLFLTAAALLAFILLWEWRRSPPGQLDQAGDRIFPGLSPHLITQIELATSSNLFIKLESADTFWMMVQPVRFPAHSSRINRFLEQLCHLQGVSHLTAQDVNRQGLGAFGFDPPQATVVLHRGTDRIEFQMGDLVPVGDAAYLRVLGAPGLEVVSADLLSLLPAQADDWRDNSLLGMKMPEFSRIDVRMAAPFGFTLDKDTNQHWRLSKPISARADNAKADHLVQQLRNAVLTGFVAESSRTNLDVFGLQSPRVELALGLATNDVLLIRFGLSPSNAPQEVFGWQSSHDQVFRVDKTLVDRLCVPYTELRDRRLLSLPSDVANSVEIRAEETIRLQQSTNTQWIIAAPVSAPADGDVLRDFFQQLNGLEILEIAREVVTDFSAFGLSPPARQILLKRAVPDPAQAVTNRLIMQLDFSTNQADRLLVRRHDENSVYALRLSDFNKLPLAAHQWRDRHVWSFASTNAQSFAIQTSGQIYRLQRGAQGRWELGGLGQSLSDPIPMMLDELIHRLGSMRVDAWLDRGEDKLSRYGIQKAESQIWEIRLVGQSAPLTLKVGDTTPTSASRFAAVMLNDQYWIFELPVTAYSLFLEVLRSLPPAPNTTASNTHS